MRKIIILIAIAVAAFKAHAQCNEGRAACNTTFQDLRYAVAKVSVPGTAGNFTGFLINHTSNDGRLLFLTSHQPIAGSCGFNPSNLATALNNATFTWNLDFPSCTGSTASTTVTSTGATLLGSSGFIALLELNNAPALPELTYLGWDITTEPSSVACIFPSPLTDVNKGIVTASAQSFVSTNIECNRNFNEASGFTTMIKISAWDAAELWAIDEGSPLIMDNKKVEGVYITGTETDCSTGPSYFFDLARASSAFLNLLRSSSSQTNSATIRRAFCKASENLNGPLNSSRPPYEVSGAIVSTQNIANGLQIKYQAGTYVELNNGFSSGTDFVAEINPCDNTVTIIAAKTDGTTEEESRLSGISAGLTGSIKIYPTALSSGNALNVESIQPLQNVAVAIYDLQGKIVLGSTIVELNSGEPHSILLSNLPSGFYLVKVWSSTISFTQKIIIK